METKNIMHVRPKVNGREISYEFEISGPWREAFINHPPSGTLLKNFGNRYKHVDVYDFDMEDVPDSISVIPFLTNVMPIAWCYNASVYVDEVDLDFFDSLEGVRDSFRWQYPEIEFQGALICKRKVQNKIREPKSSPLLLFSGGVDATFSMLGNLSIRPQLVTIRGSDIYFTEGDDIAWPIVSDMNSAVAKDHGLEYHVIESTFKLNIAPWILNKKFGSKVNDNWWHAFQHGPSLIGVCVPLAWKLGAKRVIISSSMSNKDRGRIRAGSHPDLDESIKFFGASVQHFDFCASRQDKVEFICKQSSFLGKEIPLRVCWEERTGKNCCCCEKCMRTIFAIYAEGNDPKRFNFEIGGAEESRIIEKINSDSFKFNLFWAETLDKLAKSGGASNEITSAALKKYLAAKVA